jgi:hypothetical protein
MLLNRVDSRITHALETTPAGKEALGAFLRQQIDRANALRGAHRSDPHAGWKRQLLREWQQDRLSHTYRDLLDSPRYGPAAEFFLSDLYGLTDTSARDAAVERLYPMMLKLLPEPGLQGIGLALELDALSEELDAQLLEALDGRLAPDAQISEADYCEAYRRCDNYALRRHQIDLFRGVGDMLAQIADKPLIYSLLRGMRRPARLAGFGELQDFLERGFRAFHHMEGAGEFLDTIQQREMLVLERIYARHPRPFDLDGVAGSGADRSVSLR